MPEDLPADKPHTWSDEADARTRDLLTGGSVPMHDFMPMQHIDGRFGAVPLAYAISPATGPIEVTERKTREVHAYPSLEAMIAAGWAVD